MRDQSKMTGKPDVFFRLLMSALFMIGLSDGSEASLDSDMAAEFITDALQSQRYSQTNGMGGNS